MAYKLRSPELRNLVEVTTRTFQERLLLRPSPEFCEIVLGVLGRAQARYGLTLHYFVFLSNHYHLLCSPTDPQQLARFMNFFNSKLAREAGRLHGWRGKVWDHRFGAIRISEEDAAQVGRMKYLLSQGCKEGFVITPGDWPGVQCVEALLADVPLQGLWFDRTLEYRARRRGRPFSARDFATVETITLSPLPCWDHLNAPQRRQRIVEIIADVEGEAERRRHETGREPLGAAFIVDQDPQARPLHSKHEPAPLVHAASKAVRHGFIEAYRLFVAAYRGAAEKLRSGELTVTFPEHSFPPRLPFVRGPALLYPP